MDYFVFVQVLKTTNNLHNLTLYFNIRQSLSSAYLFIDCLVLTEFQKDVNLLCIFEEVIKTYDILVFQ